MTDYEEQISPSAQAIVERLNAFDLKVDDMKAKFQADPDDAIDKMLKFALPACAGFAASKLLDAFWHKGAKRDADSQSVFAAAISGALFTGLSAAVGFLVSQAGEQGSQAIVNRRHRKHH